MSIRQRSQRSSSPGAAPTQPRVTSARRRWLRPLVVVVVTAAAFAYGGSALVRPRAQSKDAPARMFSAERAMTHVRAIAKEPHPAGSRAMVRVADYLTRRLNEIGLEVQPLVVRDPNTGVTLHVVAGRINGRDRTGAVLFVAHPDSVPQGPGG